MTRKLKRRHYAVSGFYLYQFKNWQLDGVNYDSFAKPSWPKGAR